MSNKTQAIKVGIVGTGCIGRGLALLLSKLPEYQLVGILTRRKGPIGDLQVNQDLVTTSPQRLMEKSDILVVSTGDALYSTEIINMAFGFDLPVVTMDADTQVITGSWLSKRGQITESDGDQPGCLAILKEEITQMGFKPLVYGNIKGFLNQDPSVKDMDYWAKKQGFTLHSVTSFTDGTKLQIEQALVANGLDASIARQGLIGERSADLETGAMALAAEASKTGIVMSDYIISPKAPPGVFIVAEHDTDLASGLRTYKMGEGPFYLHYKPVHLCYFEIPKTLKRFYNTREVLLSNGAVPTTGVAAVAKRELSNGTFIDRGIGSFHVRGEAVKLADQPGMIPIGLLNQAWLKRKVEPGQILTFDDVEIPESLALTAWLETVMTYQQL
ncbi:NAD(P)-dependent oxidoreductase [Geofilum rubicundum]|uniref:Homoserine dehydrogenase n=1 Tax=Geofilum rubicundum JCM 15548 TaxID=1236989 RepID=A0A0E9LUG9_9BACT|nr:NAD(P)-dependent oxidoreductase [Geofilum rubicundum]GAO28500.1 homoserine dehydrogenase [Geofilum rubicundum JCM 15548]